MENGIKQLKAALYIDFVAISYGRAMLTNELNF